VIFAGRGAGLPVDPVTSTTLAFLGAVDGAPGELDLGSAIDLFIESDDIIAPMFLDSMGGSDLFVGIDLTQWLSFFSAFIAGDEISFTNGVSDLFPGILIGTSPVIFDPVFGLMTNNPATGTFEIVGTIDGGIVPEPSTLILVGTSLLAIGTRARFRRRVISNVRV
jgi:hypothetical protein